jgi:hypothetical protein
MGVFTEANLSRMADAYLFTEITLAILSGIQSASETKLDALYLKKEEAFPEQGEMEHRFERALGLLTEWSPTHRTVLMKSYSFYTLLLAVTHAQEPVEALQGLMPYDDPVRIDHDVALANLGTLAASLTEGEAPDPRLKPFADACAKATNRLEPRQERFRWFCRALLPQLM